jgi:DNA transformation protein
MDPEHLRELFAQFGPVTVRRMFSGAGISRDGVTFALLLRDELHLKADETTVPDFEREGCTPFTYTRRQSGKTVGVMSYWRVPERLYDDPDEMAEWARRAYAVALRSPSRKRAKGGAMSRAGRASKAAKMPPPPRKAGKARKRR